MPRRTKLLLGVVILTWLPTLAIVLDRHHPLFGASAWTLPERVSRAASSSDADSSSRGAASDWVTFISPDAAQLPSGAYQVLASSYAHSAAGTRVAIHWHVRNDTDAPAAPKLQSTVLVSYANHRFCQARILLDASSQLRLEWAPAHAESPVYQTTYFFDADCDPVDEGLEWGAAVYTRRESAAGPRDTSFRIPIRPRPE